MRGKGWAIAAAMGWLALALQLYVVLAVRWEVQASVLGGLVSVFSYFTVLSNTFAAAVLTAASSRGDACLARWLRRPAVAAAATCSMLLVGIAYNLLLRTLWHPEGAQWLANQLLHNVLPLVSLAFWLWQVPRGHMRLWHLPLWALYPAGYFAFTLMRGASIGVWPYPFVDASTLGYALVWRNALGVLGGYLGIGVLMWAYDRYASSGVPSARQ